MNDSRQKRLDQLKKEFVYVAAHELRNPVTTIRTLLNVIFEDKRLTIDPLLRSYLLKMQEADERLLQLVDELLEVARSEAGQLSIKPSPQDTEEHVLAVFAELRPTALAKDVELHYEPLGHRVHVLADSMKLKEVLSNLVMNAIKYNVVGGGVTVSHEVRGKVLVTTVSDTGIGIREEDMSRIFEKFWRSEDLAVREQSGTGLGLFIVRELIERMGGAITVRSVHGKGTTFEFTLPLAPTKA
jgi:two-component system phosphate regulon sensor histidine kinase PhoR